MLSASENYREPSADEYLAAASADLEESHERWRDTLASRRRMHLSVGTAPVRPPWLLPRSALASIPAPQALIDGTLDCDSVAVLAGPTGTGKSLLALQWGAVVASGFP